MSLRRCLSAVLTAVAVVFAVVGAPASVQAHASLVAVDPPDGSTTATAPEAVTLTFTEPVSLAGGTARVLDDAGSELSGEPRAVDDQVVIPLAGSLADGTYTIAFEIISADSHRVSGATIFNVGSASTGAAYVAPDSGGLPWPVEVSTSALMAIAYGGALLAVGLWWFGVLGARVRPDEPIAERWRAWVAGSAVVAAVAELAVVPGRMLRAGGGVHALQDNEFVNSLLRGPIGVSTLIVVVSSVLVAISVSSRPASLGGTWRWLVGALTIGPFVGFALEGHSRSYRPPVMIPSDLVHGVAAGWWLGGVWGLVLLLRHDRDRNGLTRTVARFSTSALVVVLIVGGLGAVMGWIVLPGAAELTDTRYGLTLIVKVALVAVVLMIGAMNRTVVVPRLVAAAPGSPMRSSLLDRLGRLVRVEALVLGGVVVATAALVSQSPVPSTAATPELSVSAGEPETLALSQDAGQVMVDPVPATVGSVAIQMVFEDPTGAALRPIEPPTVALDSSELGIADLALAVHEIGPGTYHLTGQVPTAGEWTMTIRMRVSDFVSATASTTFTID